MNQESQNAWEYVENRVLGNGLREDQLKQTANFEEAVAKCVSFAEKDNWPNGRFDERALSARAEKFIEDHPNKFDPQTFEQFYANFKQHGSSGIW